jgi:NitT/TauT family transport system substrate-binding protein
MPMIQTRRQFLTALSLAGATSLLRTPYVLAAEGVPEITTVRILKLPSICVAPQYVADELLGAEGFTEIGYVDGAGSESSATVGRGEADFTVEFAAQTIQTIEAGAAVTILSGVHVGCYELFAKDEIRSVNDLRGKTIGVQTGGPAPSTYLTAIAAHIGVDPSHDIHWVTGADGSNPFALFADGKIDAFVAIPPEPQELRARHIGHVLFNSIVDRPWSQYFCCMLAGNREYVGKYPVATKRVLRAILKAADLCAREPERVAQRIVDGGFTARYDYAVKALREVQYDRWREYDPEDTIRYYALRLYEEGMIKSLPNKIIAENTDWRFLNELKRELKA